MHAPFCLDSGGLGRRGAGGDRRLALCPLVPKACPEATDHPRVSVPPLGLVCPLPDFSCKDRLSVSAVSRQRRREQETAPASRLRQPGHGHTATASPTGLAVGKPQPLAARATLAPPALGRFWQTSSPGWSVQVASWASAPAPQTCGLCSHSLPAPCTQAMTYHLLVLHQCFRDADLETPAQATGCPAGVSGTVRSHMFIWVSDTTILTGEAESLLESKVTSQERANSVSKVAVREG